MLYNAVLASAVSASESGMRTHYLLFSESPSHLGHHRALSRVFDHSSNLPCSNMNVSVITSWLREAGAQEVQYGVETLLSKSVTSISKADKK